MDSIAGYGFFVTDGNDGIAGDTWASTGPATSAAFPIMRWSAIRSTVRSACCCDAR